MEYLTANSDADRSRVGGQFPLALPLEPAPEVESVFLALASKPHPIFFDSALREDRLGRYSFISADPFDFLELPAGEQDPLAELDRRMKPWQAERCKDFPPFQGGAAGLFTYDLGRSLENLPEPRTDEFQSPALAVGFYDVVLAFDHLEGKAWLLSQGFPEIDPLARSQRAAARADQFLAWITEETDSEIAISEKSLWTLQKHPSSGEVEEALSLQQLAPQYPTRGPMGLTSDFSCEQYLAAVRRSIDYILAGDLFQVNLSQRLLYPARDSSLSLYLRLRQRNPAPFAGYFDLGRFQICSASPERFLQVNDSQVETRPIKGTRKRTQQPEADLFAGQELKQSEKDRAENVMIVDLMRNDLSRVCSPDSVSVRALCELESYATVQHLVSTVHGTLRAEQSSLDLLRACFPGGSITGAPKIRAMEIIAELEPTARGAYCGSLGYLGFDGTLDSSILIRTITAGRGWWQLPVGGGIVAQSTPEKEYEETWHKASGMIRALEP